MAQKVSAGNSNSFDVDAIKAQADRMEQGVARGSDERDPADLALEAEAEELTDDILFNPSTNRADEAQAFLNRPAAAKLSSGSVSAIQAAMQLQAEKSAAGFDRRNADDVWNDRKERDEKERKDQAKIADMADDANGNQLSTKPDRYGLSEQNYSGLSNDLKTKDGQERFMSFMRLLHPELTDAEIRKRLEIADAIALERSGKGTPKTKKILDEAPAGVVDSVSGDLKRFRDATMDNGSAPKVASRADAQAVNVAANTDAANRAAGNQIDLLTGGKATPSTKPSDAPAILTRTSLSTEIEGRSDFSTAPSLRDHHRAAVAATAPLDAPPAPKVLASTAPIVPAASAGLDV